MSTRSNSSAVNSCDDDVDDDCDCHVDARASNLETLVGCLRSVCWQRFSSVSVSHSPLVFAVVNTHAHATTTTSTAATAEQV